jgi:hypothetical protein
MSRPFSAAAITLMPTRTPADVVRLRFAEDAETAPVP